MQAIHPSSRRSAPLPTPARRSSFRARLGVRIRQLALLTLGSAILGVIVLASPLGRQIDKGISTHFERVNQRREHHQLTWLDGVECQVLYNGIALAGRFVSPEGGAIVWHYLYGQGRDLWLDGDYLQTSPVIQRSIQSLKPGQSRQFSLRQAEDWRLSYALNPFSLRRGDHEVLLWQRLEFSTNHKVKTVLNYELGKIELPDALIHALHPMPFTVYAKWKI
jgi:hypothetical protein